MQARLGDDVIGPHARTCMNQQRTMSGGKDICKIYVFHKLNSPPLDLALAGGYSQRRVRPPKPGEVVDLGAKFGVAVGSDSDSSDAEFAPEDEEQDSEGASGNSVLLWFIVHCIAKIDSGRV